jgi:hypothetical protein
MSIIATLLPESLHVTRLRSAVRDRHELRECTDWLSLTRTCDRESVQVAVIDLYAQGEMHFEGIRQLKQRLPRLAIVAYVTPTLERIHDLFDAGRVGIDGLVLAGEDDAPRPLLALVERSEARSLAGLVRRSLDGIDPLVADAVLLAVARAQERLSPAGLARLLAQPRRDAAARVRVLSPAAAAPYVGTADRRRAHDGRPSPERGSRGCDARLSVGECVSQHLPAVPARNPGRGQDPWRRSIRHPDPAPACGITPVDGERAALR